ncbi:MAG TPA: hypothetical protein VFM05_10045 [Candidatus Saccharimonadales bacterium]|nr:hypothetical protein [Candidatus Saccharimonadales bacterium]
MDEAFKKLLDKVNKVRASGSYDLSMEEDLSIAIMNLISLEEHFYFTGEKTHKGEYFDLLVEAREIRKQLLGRLVDKHEGETWCASKHLLAATMRLIETGTKLQADGKREEAQTTFDQAYKLYTMFWGLRLKLVELPVKKGDTPMTYEDIMSSLVDCCKE